jgi:MoaA/NifB/PqqE/SkfB family radical SAM enzyme
LEKAAFPGIMVEADSTHERFALSPKLWLYTNFDCNLRCSYCVAESTPTARRRALGLANAQRLVDEAVVLGVLVYRIVSRAVCANRAGRLSSLAGW